MPLVLGIAAYACQCPIVYAAASSNQGDIHLSHGIVLINFRFDYNLLGDKGASKKLEDLVNENNSKGEVSDQEPLSKV